MTAVVLAFGVIIPQDRHNGPIKWASKRLFLPRYFAKDARASHRTHSAAQAALDAAFARGKLVISGAVFADLLASLGAGKASQISF